MNIKIKIVLLALLVLFVINIPVYFVTEWNSTQRIENVLEDKLETLEVHYEILLHTQKTIASAMYKSTVHGDRLIEILSQASGVNEEERTALRDELYKLLEYKYKLAKEKGVLQYQFVFPNNISFLRMHKPSKFGDDLTDVRDDFKYTNETKQSIRGFTQGRTAHAFRNTFPIFDKKDKHIGALEISFSSDGFQWTLNNISHIHTHFLVDKDIFDAKTWQRDDLILKYSQSAESKNYMVTSGKIDTKEKCIYENDIKFKPIRQKIDKGIFRGEKFNFYLKHNEKIEVVSFLPIKNLKGKPIAWLVSYEDSLFIASSLKSRFVVRIYTFLISLILIYFVITQLRASYVIKQKHELLNNILDSTDNVMFITDFKKVIFSNSRFKNLLNIKTTVDFNLNNKKSIISIFTRRDGYLHEGLLKKGESFVSLLISTPGDKRVVSILDRHLNPRAFKIDIIKINNPNGYLVTLSDITIMQAKQEITNKKAYIDGLTKVYNRNKFDEILNEEMIRVKRFHYKLSIAILDIDKFKDFNDKYGHLVGDEVLIMMAQSVNGNIRKTDTFARWGGEEFVILFREISADAAKVVSQKLKDEIEQLRHEVAGGVTASFGVTQYIEGDTIETLFKRCDDALYKAKENGRNRVEVL